MPPPTLATTASVKCKGKPVVPTPSPSSSVCPRSPAAPHSQVSDSKQCGLLGCEQCPNLLVRCGGAPPRLARFRLRLRLRLKVRRRVQVRVRVRVRAYGSAVAPRDPGEEAGWHGASPARRPHHAPPAPAPAPAPAPGTRRARGGGAACASEFEKPDPRIKLEAKWVPKFQQIHRFLLWKIARSTAKYL